MGEVFLGLVGTRDLRTVWSPPVFLNQERDTQRRKAIFYLFIFNLLFLKSPPWNPLLAVLITTTLFLLKFSFSPRVRAVHHSQFQATSALWSKANNLHYSLMKLSPLPPPPSFAKHTQLSYARLRHNRGRCRAGPGRPFVTRNLSRTNVVNLYIWFRRRVKRFGCAFFALRV